MVPTETTGLDGGSSTRSASVIASITPGPGVASSSPTTTTVSAGTSARSLTQYSWKCTTRRPLGDSGVGDRDVRLDPVVGHREQPDAPRDGESQRRQSASVTCGERVAGVEHLGADQVGGDVAVAEPEPGRLHAVRRELGLHAPGLVASAPAALGVDPVAEGVHHGVEVGADLEPVHPQVVGGVGDDGHLGVGGHPRQPALLDAVQQPLQEPRATHPAGQDGEPAAERLRRGSPWPQPVASTPFTRGSGGSSRVSPYQIGA